VQQVSLRRGRRTLDDVWKAVNGVGRERDVRGGPRGGRGRGRGRGGFQQGSGDRKTALQAVRERGERGLRIGHLRYDDKPMFLGALDGNEFFITLRNVQVRSEEAIAKSVEVLKTKGFINYYGMQRFGSGSVSTHHIGIPVFKGDFKTAVEGILAARPGDMEEAEAAREAYKNGQYNEALQLMPRGHVPERSILEKMKRNLHEDGTHKGDWMGYFSGVSAADASVGPPPVTDICSPPDP
jgi:tRNA pseudouridine13 synthase